MKTIFTLVWFGYWTGVGVELSMLTLWSIWRATHSKVAHKVEDGHWFHKLSEYFE